MPGFWPELLLFVFVTHTPFFAWRWARTGELRHGATTLTFTLLSLAYGLAVFAPEIRVGGVSLHGVARVTAWLSAIVSIGLLVRHHAGRGQSPRV